MAFTLSGPDVGRQLTLSDVPQQPATASDMIQQLSGMGVSQPTPTVAPGSMGLGQAAPQLVPQPNVDTDAMLHSRGSGLTVGQMLAQLSQLNMGQPVRQPDPDFNINTATNTFYKSLGDRVASGQMTLDQAREAQAAMHQLQVNPQTATRQAATDLAQRYLQVGQYSPNNVAGQTMQPVLSGADMLRAAQAGQAAYQTGQAASPQYAVQPAQPQPQDMNMPLRVNYG